MKGYQIENVLYIFPQDAAQIPSVAETVEAIAIQPELLEAFKALNEDYADIMVPYNYNIMAVNAKPWAGHTDDDIEVEPEPEVLPEVGTVFNFTGYATADSETPSSTGTVTYNGIYEGTPTSDLPTDGTYVWGTAKATFANETTAEVPVFILRSDVPTLLDGGRVLVKSVNASDPTTTANFGYGEFTTQEPEVLPEVGTQYQCNEYSSADSETPMYRGTFTYLGLLPRNNNYVYGKFKNGGMEWYLVPNKSDLSKVNTGEKFQVYAIGDDYKGNPIEDIDDTMLVPDMYVDINI